MNLLFHKTIKSLYNPNKDGCLVFSICNMINFTKNKQIFSFQDANSFYMYLKTNNTKLLNKYLPSFDPLIFSIDTLPDGICLAFNDWYGKNILETKKLDINYFSTFLEKKPLICSIFLSDIPSYHAILLTKSYMQKDTLYFLATDTRYQGWNNFNATKNFLSNNLYPLENNLKEVIICH